MGLAQSSGVDRCISRPHLLDTSPSSEYDRMLKFYYSGAPNPAKVALFLEEAGIPYEAIPVDTRKGDQHKPEFLRINPNAKVPAIVDGDVDRVRFQRHPALSRRQDRQVPAAASRQEPRRVAVLADVRRLRRGSVRRPVGAFPALRAGEAPLRDQPLRFRGAAAFRRSQRRGWRSSKYMVGDTYTIVDMDVWGWARMCRSCSARMPGRNSRT